jgi:protein CpxP
MRKLIFTAILFISMGTMAFAQQDSTKKSRKTPEERAQHFTDALDKKLSLTADQKTKIYAINLEGMKKAKGKHVKGQKPDMAAMKASMEERDSQISGVLNEGQRKTYQEIKAKRAESFKKHGKKGDKHKSTPEKV